MAGVQWSDGKMHGATEAKNSMMHDTKDTRLIHGHSNPDIDKTKTPNNFSYRGLTYKEKCARYDELMDKVRIKRKSSGKNTNVTLQKMVIAIPADMQDGENYDPARLRAWADDVGRLLEEDYGELLIDIDVHVDEVHKYLDVSKPKDDPNRMGWSRIHLHVAVVPAVTEVVTDREGNPVLSDDGTPKTELVLNSYKFSQKKNIIRLNNRIQEMTKTKYGMDFMTGSGKGKKHHKVEDLKHWTAKAMLEEDAGFAPTHSKSEGADAESLEYAKKVRIQAEEEAKQITDQAKSEAEAMTAAAKAQAEELSQITLQQVMARIAKMRAKLELEAKEKEESDRNQEKALQDAQAALAQDRMVLDHMKADIDATREQVEREKQETTKRLAISRADHLQQRRLNQKALSTEIAATDRLIALNDREETLVRRERALRPVATTYNMLKAIHEHERKSENRENADAIRETLRLIYNANSTPGSWIHEVENEYLRSRQQGHRPGSEVVASSARPLPTVAANMPGY